ncbi:hypothetical protein GMDG_06176 [Pseudogymnoascus destructans 20631-21]|uniref:Uncharacterized protein n=1 Tax=Pseudogymnoascus destructans (strain ATCC MYA-4855 / 20631-21) TaxID=658429 RepID=L8FSI8_PSED2|nr:hypothetical protein GMDG_06176 [Pseudogymnoascus destructans 20631-21]
MASTTILRFPFSQAEWAATLKNEQKHLHERMLKLALVDGIMAQHWAKSSISETCRQKHRGTEDGDLGKARRRGAYLKWVVAPVAECVDWDGITRGRTVHDRTIQLWMKASIMMVADTAWVEG